MNVLIVDDEIIQVESLRRGLRSKGYRVAEAFCAQEALNLLNSSERSIDLVITDYAMPVMNGIELLQNIRRDNPSLPVIMMTAYGQKDMVIDVLRNHCSGFIEKPFTLEQLLREIDRVKVGMLQNTSLHLLPKVIPGLVHEINNPLAAILASAELAMLALSDTVTLKRCIGRIKDSVEKITRINREIMEAGRLSMGEMTKMDLNILIDDCLAMFSDALTLKGIAVEKNMAGGDLSLWGNRFEIEQTLSNLIVNSIDSMDGASEKLLRISVATDRNDCSTRVTIEDTGCGIPEEFMDKIFTPYFTRKENGTGLGLAVVKSVVEKHKGTMQISSRIGIGTVFTVRFPQSVEVRGQLSQPLNLDEFERLNVSNR